MSRSIQAHYIKHNAAARVPERLICLDTESTRELVKSGEDQRWLLGVASFVLWSKTGEYTISNQRFTTPASLWRAVTDFTRIKRRTVVYAHNVGYDVRISQALAILPSLGWSLTDARLTDRGTWWKWSRKQATLAICDSVSIFNTSLNRIGDALGITKLPLPPPTNIEDMFLRCERDVKILTTAMIEYFKWLRTGECGNWQMTGAGQSWAHWRHSHMTHKILVHDNADAVEAERRAMWTGRCEAWQWGEHPTERIHEYDYSNAYPRIAHDVYLPTKLRGESVSTDIDKVMGSITRYAILADVSVYTAVPTVPTSHDGRIIWPTGHFRTVLWDPEIQILRKYGATIRVHKAWYYSKEPALKQWGEWALSTIHDETGNVPQWKKLVVKNWSRTLIGRFAMRFKAWDQIAESPNSEVWISDYHDSDTGETGKLMQIGHNVLIESGEIDGNDYCPQITGYIMSEGRAKIYEAAQLAGTENVLYMDTDSLVVNTSGSIRIDNNSDVPLLAGLVRKQSSRGYRIYGPRAIIFDRSKKVSGLPRQAVETTPHEYIGVTWESATTAIAAGLTDTVRLRNRKFAISPNQARRYLRRDGTTSPYELPSGDPVGGYEQAQTLETQALADGYPGILLGLIPESLKDPDLLPNKGLRYSVRNR